MVIIAEANMLSSLDDGDKKVISTLTASDKIIILSDKKSAVSIETMQLFLGLKAKAEFVQVDDLKAQFSLGFRYGEFSAKYAKDKVKILTNNDYSAVLGVNMMCVKTLANVKKNNVQPPVEKKREKAPTKAVNNVEEKKIDKAVVKSEPVSAPEKAASTKRRGKLKDLSAESILAAYPELEPYATKIKSLSGMFAQAIKASTDAETSLKMQMRMLFADSGEDIWKIIKKDYAKLKALA